MYDEFQARIANGSSLLEAGNADAARADFVVALALRPEDPGARGLLAQAEFRRGAHDAAAALYEGLVRDNPTEPSLQVNLGLVHLKAGRVENAIHAFQGVCDLVPDHRRARAYLGLALARRGDPAAAREEFLRAGEEAMARRMEDLAEAEASASGASVGAVAAGGLARLEVDEQPFGPAVETVGAAEGWQMEGPTADGPRGMPGILPPPLHRIPTLATFVELARLPAPPEGPFATGPFGAAVEVRGALLTRLDGVYAARGVLGFEPAQKRFRGRGTEQTFGEGPQQVFRATGKGTLLVSPKDLDGADRTLVALSLTAEDAFFCEGAIFAFDESLDHENGRVPGPPADLPLVRLRGNGHVLLATAGRVRSLRIAGEPLRVRAARLVGWTGFLAPRLLPEDGPVLGLELAGEGDVLLVP